METAASAQKMILEKRNHKVKLTKANLQKIIIEEFGIEIKDVKYFCGHSLGEYSALVSIGSLNFEDALYLLYERGKSMQEAVPEGKGAMLAVLGLKMNEIEDYIKQTKTSQILAL